MIRTAKDASDIRRELPSGWRLVRLGDVCERYTGTRDPRDEPDITFRYIDISSVDNGSKRIKEVRTLLGADAPSRARQVIRHNDILVATTRPNLNAVAMVPSDLDGEFCSTGFCVLRATGDLSPKYLFAYVQHEAFVVALSDLVKGALYPAVTDSQVRAQSIPLPPFVEQKRIAAILSEQMAAVERAQAAAQAQLDDAKALPSAYLSQVFNSHEARSWQRKRLNEICKISTGTTPSRSRPEYFGDGTPWVTPGDFDGSLYISSGRESLTPLGVSEGRGRTFPKGSVLLVCIGATVGKIAIASCVISANQQINVLICGEFVLPEFLYFHLRFDRSDFIAAAASATLPIINQERLGIREIPLPPIAEQRRIASMLSEQVASAENLWAGLEAHMAEIKALPAALLRRAFAGEL